MDRGLRPGVKLKNLATWTVPLHAQQNLALRIGTFPAGSLRIEICRTVGIDILRTTTDIPAGYLTVPEACHVTPDTARLHAISTLKKKQQKISKNFSLRFTTKNGLPEAKTHHFGGGRSVIRCGVHKGWRRDRQSLWRAKKTGILLVISSFVFFDNCSDIAGFLIFSVKRTSRVALVQVRPLDFYPVLRGA